MEAVALTTMVMSVVTYLGNHLSKNEAIDDLLTGVTERSAKWLKELITTDPVVKPAMEKLKGAPDSEGRKKMVAGTIQAELDEHPEVEKHIMEIFEKIRQTQDGEGIYIQIRDSKNVNTGNVDTGGGDFRMGDNNVHS